MMRSFLFLFSLSLSIIYPGNEPILKLFSIFADFNFAERLIFNLKQRSTISILASNTRVRNFRKKVSAKV